jgi:hypothetical protein
MARGNTNESRLKADGSILFFSSDTFLRYISRAPSKGE